MQNVLRKEKHTQIKPYSKWTLFLQGGLGIIHYASLKAGLPSVSNTFFKISFQPHYNVVSEKGSGKYILLHFQG